MLPGPFPEAVLAAHGATVFGRLFVGGHCVDLEHWWREDPETCARIEGTELVRYSLRDGRIGVV